MAEKCSETKIRYLELIQNVITRMANNSFMLKGWAVTLVAGIFVLAGKDSDKYFFLIPVVLFWLMDSYYLQQERLYRKLYSTAVKLEEEDIDMEFDLCDPEYEGKTKYLQSVFSKTEAGFYVSLATAVGVIICFAC